MKIHSELDDQEILRDIYEYFSETEQFVLDGEVPLEMLRERDIHE